MPQRVNCVVVIRYSNMNMTEIYEYHMLPYLRQHREHKSNERNGFFDVFQQALRKRLDIKLVVSNRTCLPATQRLCRSSTIGVRPTSLRWETSLRMLSH